MTGAHIRFSPRILGRLGEELIPNIDQGIIELVRNAYDADATTCRIELRNVDKAGGQIIVSDNGDGMNDKAIRDGWLLLGTSSKNEVATTRRGRTPVGDKGLGRLAALRFGKRARLATRPRGTKRQFSLDIRWADYETVDAVEKVSLEIKRQASKKGQGTDISLVGLKSAVDAATLDRLARSLVLLADPFEGVDNFKTTLVAPGYKDLEKLVSEGYLDQAEFRLEGTVDEKGLGSAKVMDWKGKVLWQSTSTEWAAKKPKKLRPTYSCPPVQIQLWVFVLAKESFATRSATITQVREWLKVVGGIHLYQSGFRVPPYGDPGHDWLDMNLARSRSPESRPSTNTTVGRVVILGHHDALQQKTDRVGFVENKAFQDVRRFSKDALDWFADQRLKRDQQRRGSQKSATTKAIKRTRQKLTESIQTNVPPAKRADVEKVVKKFELASQARERMLQDELRLYRTLATAGTTAAVFAHEVGKPISNIPKLVGSIRNRVKVARPKTVAAQVEKPLGTILKSIRKLKIFATAQLSLLQRDKRRPGRIDLHKTIHDVDAYFAPLLDDSKIDIDLNLASAQPYTNGAISLVESILTNFLTNSVNAFGFRGARRTGRKVRISTSVDGDVFTLVHEDNGPGISMPISDIWLPGKTTVEGGTGFGLTIVQDCVSDLGGRINARAKGELGGAEFTVELPILGA